MSDQIKEMADLIQFAVEYTPYWKAGDPTTHQDPYANAAIGLVAAGYGTVTEAKSEAWNEGHGAGWNDCLLDMENRGAKSTINPYREQS